MSTYGWHFNHAIDGCHRYTITRDGDPVAMVELVDDVAHRAWHVSNICDVFRQIDRANQPAAVA